MEILAFGTFLALIISILNRRENKWLESRFHDMSFRLDLLRIEHYNLFEPRKIELPNSTIPLIRTNTHMGWYTTTDDISEYKNKYYEVEISKELVKTQVMKIRFKKECLVLLDTDTDADITKDGCNISDEGHMKPNDRVYFNGNILISSVKITIFELPYIKEQEHKIIQSN